MELGLSSGSSSSIDRVVGNRRILKPALPILFWVLLLSPIPAVIKLVSAILILVLCDIEFVYVIAILAGFFKVWGTIDALNQIMDLTVLATTIVIARTGLYLMFSKSLRIDKLTARFVFYTVVFAGIMLLSLSWTLDPVNGLDKVARFCVLTNAIIVVPIIYRGAKRRSGSKFILYFLLHSVAFSLMAVSMRVSQVANADYIGLGRLAGMGLLISIFFLLLGKEKSGLLKIGEVLIILFCILITGGALFYSGARGPTISLGVTLLLMWLLSMPSKKRFLEYSRIIGIVLILTGIAISLGVVPLTAYYRFIQPIEQGKMVLGARWPLFKGATEMFVNSPVWGQGVGSFGAYISGVHGYNTYPHNVALEIAGELGLLGIFAFGAMFYVVLQKAGQLLRSISRGKWYIYGLISLLIFSLLNSFISGDLNSNKFLWFSIGILFAYEAPRARRDIAS